MTLQQCKYVLTVAQEGSFSKAAKALYVSQSGLSESVKALESELGITIFGRSSNGVTLTDDGAEFLRYATVISAQDEFIRTRYANDRHDARLDVVTQHYDFVADVFAGLVRDLEASCYRLSLREKQTYDVIEEVALGKGDLGVLAIKEESAGILKRYLSEKGLLFTPFLTARPHVYLRRDHPLVGHEKLSAMQLKGYPFVTYEQGDHNVSFFAEEIELPPQSRQIEISDRATLMNLLLASDGYTLGTGVMPSQLNGGSIVSIPFECNDFYTIGYLRHPDRVLSAPARALICSLGNLAHTERRERGAETCR